VPADGDVNFFSRLGHYRSYRHCRSIDDEAVLVITASAQLALRASPNFDVHASPNARHPLRNGGQHQ
jgi:hypothetical protein